MKIHVYTIDFEPPRWLRRAISHGLPIALVCGAGVAYANVDHVFQPNEVLKAADLNANFGKLDGRVTTVEVAATDLDGRVGALEQPTRSAFKALRSTSITVPSTTPTGIVYDNELFDRNGEYDPATGAFKPKQAGTYFIQCASFVTSTGAIPSILTSIIVRNGAELFSVDHQSTANTLQGQVTSTIAELAANDTINCGYFHTASGSLTVNPGGGPRAHFFAFRID